MNLLALVNAPPSEALINLLEGLLDAHKLAAASRDLRRLEERLSELADGPGGPPEVLSFAHLIGSHLQQALNWLALLEALYRGKLASGNTSAVRAALAQVPPQVKEPRQLQLAIVELHQLKSA